MPASGRSFLVGLPLGALLSFAAGCLYAYAVWNPPSNDWGNEKASATLLLVPVVVVLLVVAGLARRRLARLVRRSVAIGRAGMVGVVVGAVILPIAELIAVGLEWHGVQAQVPIAREAARTELAEIGRRLKQADLVVIERPAWTTSTHFDWFIVRLAAFTAKPVYVAYDKPSGGQPQILRQYTLASGAPCAIERAGPPSPASDRQSLVAVSKCLTGTDIADFQDWPEKGVVLHIEEDFDLVSYNKPPFSDGSLYSTFTVAMLQKPASMPTAPYTQTYPPDAIPTLVWRNRCFIKKYGPFPFGRGVHWHLCPQLLGMADAAERIFGSVPVVR